MKGQRIAWSARQLAFIKRRRKWPRQDLHAAFVKKFRRRDVSLGALCSLCKRSGWLTGPRAGRGKGRSLVYSDAELVFLSRRRRRPRRQLHAEFVRKFRRPNHAYPVFTHDH